VYILKLEIKRLLLKYLLANIEKCIRLFAAKMVNKIIFINTCTIFSEYEIWSNKIIKFKRQ